MRAFSRRPVRDRMFARNGELPMSAAQKSRPILIKRYQRSRLYDVANQRYVSIEQLRGWAADGVAFVVLDSETGADVTRVVLA